MMRSIFLAISVFAFAKALADDGPVGRDVSIVVTSYSFVFDDTRSESLETFEAETADNHGGSYQLVICPQTSPKRLAELLEFLKQHAPSASVDIVNAPEAPPRVCQENG